MRPHDLANPRVFELHPLKTRRWRHSVCVTELYEYYYVYYSRIYILTQYNEHCLQYLNTQGTRYFFCSKFGRYGVRSTSVVLVVCMMMAEKHRLVFLQAATISAAYYTQG